LCEGIETIGELGVLQDFGVRLIQGYLLAKPAFEALAIPAPMVPGYRDRQPSRPFLTKQVAESLVQPGGRFAG
ncbi:hypothetical protein M8523_34435, partial [Hyphomicrobiales bacterium BP6-180914]|nr:hypothetical protein [Lichenifustis flavocetrariae]